MAAPLHGQQNTGCQKTWGKGVKRTEMIRMDCSTPGLALWQGSPARRFNGRFACTCEQTSESPRPPGRGALEEP